MHKQPTAERHFGVRPEQDPLHPRHDRDNLWQLNSAPNTGYTEIVEYDPDEDESTVTAVRDIFCYRHGGIALQADAPGKIDLQWDWSHYGDMYLTTAGIKSHPAEQNTPEQHEAALQHELTHLEAWLNGSMHETWSVNRCEHRNEEHFDELLAGGFMTPEDALSVGLEQGLTLTHPE